MKREYENGSVEYFHDDVTYKKELACDPQSITHARDAVMNMFHL